MEYFIIYTTFYVFSSFVNKYFRLGINKHKVLYIHEIKINSKIIYGPKRSIKLKKNNVLKIENNFVILLQKRKIFYKF